MKIRMLGMFLVALFVLSGCGGDDTPGQAERSTLLATEGVSCPNPAEITLWDFSLDCDIIDASVMTCEENSLAWFAYRIYRPAGFSEWTVVPMSIDLTNFKRHNVQVTLTEDTDRAVYYKFITINGPGSDEEPPQPSSGYSQAQNRGCAPMVFPWSGGPEKFYAQRSASDASTLRLGWHAYGCDHAFSVLEWGYDEQVENSTPVPYRNGDVVYFDLTVSPGKETIYFRLVLDPYCSENATTTLVESIFTDLVIGSGGGKEDPIDLPDE
jgi:hypothetical protein